MTKREFLAAERRTELGPRVRDVRAAIVGRGAEIGRPRIGEQPQDSHPNSEDDQAVQKSPRISERDRRHARGAVDCRAKAVRRRKPPPITWPSRNR